MIGVSFWRVSRAAFQNFMRNIWLTLATTVIMTITLLIVLFLYFANVFGFEVLQNIQQKVDLSVVFKGDVEEAQMNLLADRVEARSDVAAVDIVTSEEARAIFLENNRDRPFIEESLAELEDNPLPASMFVVATEPQHYQAISEFLSADRFSPLIDEVQYEDSRGVIDKLTAIIAATKNVGVVVTVIFATLVVLIMFNTVRLAIYSFREEIDIMRLVGASRWFIRGPFMIESIFVALVSVCLATLIVYPALNGISPWLQQFFFEGFVQQEPFDIYAFAVVRWPTVFGLQLAVAVGLAILSSLIAIQRYLKA